MTVFLPAPTTLTEIFWARIRTVRSVLHSWAGCANNGGAPTRVTGSASFTKELYADHTGTGGWSLSSSLGASWPVRVRDTIQVAFSSRMFWGNSCSDDSSNVGYAGEGGLDSGSTHGIKDVSDSGSSVTERHESFGSPNLSKWKAKRNNSYLWSKMLFKKGIFSILYHRNEISL